MFQIGIVKLFCTFEPDYLRICFVNQVIDSEDYVLASPITAIVESFKMSYNRDIRFLPKQIGQKFPVLQYFEANGCGLTILRDHYFKDMRFLRKLHLSGNLIKTIESNSFTDLVSVELLVIVNNKIETLPKSLFITMVKLEGVHLEYNKIKSLNPGMFTIMKGQLSLINLEDNICIDRLYKNDNLYQLYDDLKSNCTG